MHCSSLWIYLLCTILSPQGPEDVKAMGIGEYNQQCRKIVMRYSTEWEVGGQPVIEMMSQPFL